MRYSDIIQRLTENYDADMKRMLRDSLISLKIQGQTTLKTEQVLKDFAERGINISVTDLLDILQGDPLIKDANEDTIELSTDVPDVDVNNEQHAEINAAATVNNMANQALPKNFR